MSYNALNPKLQDVCLRIGLWAYNTMYSFRREAISNTRRRSGVERAQELAGHVPGHDSLRAYDPVGMGDEDITAYRLGEQQKISRSEINDIFRQANYYRYEPGDDEPDLKELLRTRVEGRLKTDDEYIAIENGLMNIILEMHAYLVNAGHLPPDSEFGYHKKISNEYRVRLVGVGDGDKKACALVIKHDDYQKSRKKRHESMRRRIGKELLAEMKSEYKDQLISSKRASKSTYGLGRLSAPIREQNKDASSILDFMTQQTGDAAEAAVATLDSEEVEDEGADPHAIGEQLQATNFEPEHWMDLPEDGVITVQMHRDVEEGATEDEKMDARNAFLKYWISKVGFSPSPIPTPALNNF
jgi:hypothetical protein